MLLQVCSSFLSHLPTFIQRSSRGAPGKRLGCSVLGCCKQHGAAQGAAKCPSPFFTWGGRSWKAKTG